MPYRPTERTEAKRAATRERVVAAARELIARGGYREA
jgi:AcrR family transcriptional regulator